MDFSLVAPRGNKRKPKKVEIYLDTVWFTLPVKLIEVDGEIHPNEIANYNLIKEQIGL